MKRKVRKYRLVIRNLEPDDEWVEETMREELEEEVQVVSWEVERFLFCEENVINAGPMEQRYGLVMVHYRDKS